MSKYQVEWWPGILPWSVLNPHGVEVGRCETWEHAMRIAVALSWHDHSRRHARPAWHPTIHTVEIPTPTSELKEWTP